MPACPAAQWFARLWEIEPHDFWGYITNCGTGAPPVCMCGQACKWGLPQDAAPGQQHRQQDSWLQFSSHHSRPPCHPPLPPAAEGNLHGILVGRENLPDGILYASRETHYSVFKAARMYRMDAVKVRPDSRQRCCCRCCWSAAGWRCL